MYSNKLKRWETALMVGVAVALLTGALLEREHRQLAREVIRLHVIANSDSGQDQELKLRVRDRVLARVSELCGTEENMDAALDRLEGQLGELERVGRQAVREQGRDDPVRVSLGPAHFPTKRYEGFALPAGEYTALRVVIGEGRGQNWWCVAFPPLCLGSGVECLEQAAQAGYFSADQLALVTGEDEGYVIKFKALELWDRVKQLFAD